MAIGKNGKDVFVLNLPLLVVLLISQVCLFGLVVQSNCFNQYQNATLLISGFIINRK